MLRSKARISVAQAFDGDHAELQQDTFFRHRFRSASQHLDDTHNYIAHAGVTRAKGLGLQKTEAATAKASVEQFIELANGEFQRSN